MIDTITDVYVLIELDTWGLEGYQQPSDFQHYYYVWYNDIYLEENGYDRLHCKF